MPVSFSIGVNRKCMMSLFEDMTLMEMAEIAYDILSDRVVLTQGEIADFQKEFSSRIAQCEQLEVLKERGLREPPGNAA